MITAWFKRERKKESVSLLKLHPASNVADTGKVARVAADFERGLNNYLIFQRFSDYYWPLWLSASLNEFARHFQPLTPCYLNNNYNRDYLSFTNILSPIHLLIDPSGMISPAEGIWSIETWVISNNTLFRPQRTADSIQQFRDEQSTLITTNWLNDQFTVSTEIYGTRTSIDEAIIDINCQAAPKNVSGKSLVVAIRPYNIDTIGGLSNLEYRDGSRTVRINKRHIVHFSKNPREVYTGSGEIGDLLFKERQERVSCGHGMATMALVYPFKKNGFDLKLRLSLTEGKPVDALKLNYPVIKKDFTDYSNLMKYKGFNVTTADHNYHQWFYSTKLIALGRVNNTVSALRSDVCGVEIWKKSFFLILALNRMGYESEAKLIIENWHKTLILPEKPVFTDILKICYFISAFADYFTMTRDSEFLQFHYEKIRIIAGTMLKFEDLVIKQHNSKNPENSIPVLFSSTSHVHDLLLYAHSLGQYAYLCRTIGLFGDEIKFNKESQKLHESISHAITGLTGASASRDHGVHEPDAVQGAVKGDEFIAYMCYCNFPFHVDGINNKDCQKLMALIAAAYGKFPLFIKSLGGWDTFLTIMIATNLLLLKDPRSYEIFDIIQNLGGRKYSLAEYINPVTLRGTHGSGESSHVNSGIFLLIRNTILFDTPNRLELFPLPVPEWFQPGFEMAVENAPTRFGKINFKLLSTQNEVQLFFNELPKFIPPEIMINLPFKAVLNDGEDFVLKKEEGNSFIINGWPSIIRFGRQ